MITYKLHLIRHGQTEGNQKGLFVGRTDMPVSEEGFDELSRLRDTYEYPRVGAVYTSPLRRCIQTAGVPLSEQYAHGGGRPAGDGFRRV